MQSMTVASTFGHRNIPFETMKCRWVFAALKSLMANTAGCCQPLVVASEVLHMDLHDD